jgi:hypothetical protein
MVLSDPLCQPPEFDKARTSCLATEGMRVPTTRGRSGGVPVNGLSTSKDALTTILTGLRGR